MAQSAAEGSDRFSSTVVRRGRGAVTASLLLCLMPLLSPLGVVASDITVTLESRAIVEIDRHGSAHRLAITLAEIEGHPSLRTALFVQRSPDYQWRIVIHAEDERGMARCATPSDQFQMWPVAVGSLHSLPILGLSAAWPTTADPPYDWPTLKRDLEQAGYGISRATLESMDDYVTLKRLRDGHLLPPACVERMIDWEQLVALLEEPSAGSRSEQAGERQSSERAEEATPAPAANPASERSNEADLFWVVFVLLLSAVAAIYLLRVQARPKQGSDRTQSSDSNGPPVNESAEVSPASGADRATIEEVSRQSSASGSLKHPTTPDTPSTVDAAEIPPLLHAIERVAVGRLGYWSKADFEGATAADYARYLEEYLEQPRERREYGLVAAELNELLNLLASSNAQPSYWVAAGLDRLQQRMGEMMQRSGTRTLAINRRSGERLSPERIRNNLIADWEDLLWLLFRARLIVDRYFDPLEEDATTPLLRHLTHRLEFVLNAHNIYPHPLSLLDPPALPPQSVYTDKRSAIPEGVRESDRYRQGVRARLEQEEEVVVDIAIWGFDRRERGELLLERPSALIVQTRDDAK